MARSIFTEFYCLPIEKLLAMLLVALCVFLWLHERFRSRRQWKLLLAALLAVFAGIILYLTVSSREASAQRGVFLVPFHSYRAVLEGGNPEILRSNLMNVVLFFPMGLLATALLPQSLPRWLRCLLPLVLFTGLSVGVEYVQFTCGMGQAEIDDVIHNALGTLLGSLCSLLPAPLRHLEGP